MLAIVSPPAPFVNPALLPPAVRPILAVVEPPVPIAPTTADAFEPSLADQWAEIGLALGRTGVRPTAAETFPDATAREMLLGSHWFAEGVHTGYGQFAHQVGREMGLAGADCERPESIPGRFAMDFEGGWIAGDSERSERVRLEAEWADYDRDYEYERWIEEQSVRESEGWPFVFVGGWPLSVA